MLVTSGNRADYISTANNTQRTLFGARLSLGLCPLTQGVNNTHHIGDRVTAPRNTCIALHGTKWIATRHIHKQRKPLFSVSVPVFGIGH